MSLETAISSTQETIPSFNPQPLHAIVTKLVSENSHGLLRLPCGMGEDLDKFHFNLGYQDARVKIEVEDMPNFTRKRHRRSDMVRACLQLIASALTVSLPHGGFLWQRMNDNDLDALVFSALEGCDPKRQLKLLACGFIANQTALDGLPPLHVIRRWNLLKLIECQVFAGTVWWPERGGYWRTCFETNRQMVIDHRDRFLDEVENRAHKLLFFSDDNGEVVWDLLLIRRLLEEFPKLHVAFVTNTIPVGNNSNILTVQYCLNHPLLAMIRGQSRFRIVAEENPRSTLEPEFFSEALRTEVANAELVFLKGVGLFETAQRFPKPAYFAFVVHSNDSEIITGLSKGSGVFVQVPARAVAYAFRKHTLLDFLNNGQNCSH